VTPLGFRSLLVLAACTALLLAGCPDQPTQPAPDTVYLGKPVSNWSARLQDKDVKVRRQAAEALATHLGEKRGAGESLPEAMFPVLAQALRDQDAEVRQKAAKALYYPCVDAQEPLPNVLLSALAEALLNNTPWADECLLSFGRDALRIFNEALKDSDPAVRKVAVGGLSGLAGGRQKGEGRSVQLAPEREPLSPTEVASVVSALIEILQKDKSKEVRESAAYALSDIGEPAAQTLGSAAQSSDVTVRRLAVRSLRMMAARAKKAVPTLAKLLKDDDGAVRWEAFIALEQMGDDAWAALPALLEASMADDSSSDRAWAAVSKMHKVPRSSAPALLPFLKDAEPKIRLKVAELLCELEEGDPQCLAVLVELVKRRDSQIRKGAAQLLYRYGSKAKEAVPALIEIARNDADSTTRLAAVNALGAIGPDAKVAIPALKALLDDKALGIGPKEALKKIDQ
jgi:HEAT repeat protein